MKLEMAQGLQGKRATVGRAALRALTYRFGTYQPVLLDGKVIAQGKRGTERRSEIVCKVTADLEAATVFDLGCAEGYMVRRCAEDGRLAMGVDGDARRLLLAQLSTALDGLSGVGFIKAPIDLETVPTFPKADVTVCMSLLHHLMYQHGVDYARDLLVAVRERTRKALVFEMGQSDETRFAWAAQLPDMGADPHEWIRRFVVSAGFRSVEKVAEVESFNSPARRATLVARP